MNQPFKLRFDQLRDNDPTRTESAKADAKRGDGADPLAHQFYETAGYTRNLCLAWPDGRRMMLNYAYLISADLLVEQELNEIVMVFSAHIIRLKGYALENLFMNLMDHLPRVLVMNEERYIDTADNREGVIVTMILESK